MLRADSEGEKAGDFSYLPGSVPPRSYLADCDVTPHPAGSAKQGRATS